MLNTVLLGICICIVAVIILYLFYWNRLVGFILSVICRLVFWNQGESSIWVDIGSIQFSILAGRILFKDLRYHSSNQTILILKGQVSWRYWIRAPAQEGDLASAQMIGEGLNDLKAKRPLSCRVHVSLRGLEWFIYNRTAAYDNIIATMESAALNGNGGGAARGDALKAGSAINQSSFLAPQASILSSFQERTPKFLKRSWAWIVSQLPNLDPKDLLPLSIEVNTGAITCGNSSTPNLLVAEFGKAEGTYGIVPSKSKYDLYKQLLSLTFQNASIRLLENEDHRDKMANQGSKYHARIQRSDGRALRRFSYLSFSTFHKLWKQLSLWKFQPSASRPYSHVSTTTSRHHRTKSDKTAVEEYPVGGIDSEYAQERKILETPVLEMLYFADVVGTVPLREVIRRHPEDPLDIGNGDSPPEWGLDLAINGGVLRYGPWTDRQRSELQQTFLPSQFAHLEPHPQLRPGDTRVWTSMKIFVELRDGVVLQLPFREASKNWQWDGKKVVSDRPRTREAASIHVRAGDCSTISYFMPMVASSAGYEPTLEVHLDTVIVTSSLNDIKLLTADSCRVHCDLPSPLRWNAAREWTFSIALRRPNFWLLRDHINMFTDLGKDWSSGPPTDHNRFVPTIYSVNLDLQQGYEINTYVNDQNIIDKPLIKEENALLTIRGPSFIAGIRTQLTKYRPTSNAVPFWIHAQDVSVSLTLPRWNTHSLYPTAHRSDIGRVGNLVLDGSYRFYGEVNPEFVDCLKLNFSASDVVYKACGWSIRHFMILRDNYFGSFTHFSTLSEYLQKRDSGKPVGDLIELQYREAASNALHVELSVSLDSGLMVVPAGLPGYEAYNLNEAYNLDEMDIGASLIIALPSLQLCLRTNEYYMDMSLNIETASGRIQDHCSEKLWSTGASEWNEKETFVIDGIDISANRLFGPQPLTATYVCIWEIHIGEVKAVLSAAEARLLSAAATAFKLNFSDPLNSPAEEFAVRVDPDVTFIKIILKSMSLIWHADDVAVEVNLPRGLRLDSNDWSGQKFKKITSIRIPEVIARTLLQSKISPHVWFEAASFEADADLDLYSAPPGWQAKAEAQREFIMKQDELTSRCKFLYELRSDEENAKIPSGRGMIENELYLPQLRVPTGTGSATNRPRRKRTEATPHSFLSPVPPPTDSEDEEVEPEAIRDARLAQSKPRPRPLQYDDEDNESMSSGDESDNDVTDYHSDSDSIHSQDGTRETSPLIASNSRFTAHFISRFLDRPSFWNGSPFLPSKRCFIQPGLPRHRKIRSISAPYTLVDLEAIEELDDATAIHIASSRGVHIWITPLVLPAVDSLVKDLSSHQLSPELRFDAIMASHIQSFTPQKTGRTLNAFDIRLPLISVCVTQAISGFEGDREAPEFIEEVAYGRTDFISSISVRLENPHARGLNISGPSADDLSLLFSISSASFELEGYRDVEADRSCPLSCGLSGRNSMVLASKQLTISLDDIHTHVEHDAPNLAVASSVAALGWFNDAVTTYRQFADCNPKLDQSIIFQVLSLARDRSIVDPLSTIQPSYLIQRGRPHEIRTDTIFRFLVYLRNCLRYLVARERLSLPSLPHELPEAPSVMEIKSLMENQLAQSGAEMDLPTFASHALLADLFSVDGGTSLTVSTVQAGGSLPLESIRFGFEHFKIAVSHPSQEFSSSLSVTRFSISATARTVEWMPPTSKSPSASSAQVGAGPFSVQISTSVIVGDVAFSILPQLLDFVQIVVRVDRLSDTGSPDLPPSSPTQRAAQTRFLKPSLVYGDAELSLQSFRLKAAAETLVIEYKADQVTLVTSGLANMISSIGGSPDLSLNQSLVFQSMRLQACSVADLSKPKDYAVLASCAITDGRGNVTFRQEVDGNRVLRVAFGMADVRLPVPRSAMRLYRFVEDWKADYLPAFNRAFKAILNELDTGKPQMVTEAIPNISKTPSLVLELNISFTNFLLSLQVMHGIWVSWEIHHTVAYLTDPQSLRKDRRTFGVQVGSQRVSITSQTGEATSDMRLKFDFPTFTLTGHNDGTRVHALALVEFFHFTIKPSHWDTILSVQQKFGNDFNDFFNLVDETRRKSKESSNRNKPLTKKGWQYSILLKLRGFRVGLEGHSSTLYLECEDIGGAISRDVGLAWRITLSDLALSLAPRTKRRLPGKKSSAVDRGRRSAFVIVDFYINMTQPPFRQDDMRLNIALTKIHAVMQPSSISELGDFVDHLQVEIYTRRDQRASELAAFKEKTRNIMRTFDAKIGETQPNADSWWDKYSIILNIKQVGIAFPLALNQNLQLPRSGSCDDEKVKAFLFSIQSIEFGTHKGESGEVTMKGFSFQFVSSFQQSKPESFSGEAHMSRNRLVYPVMTAQLRSERTKNSRRTQIKADVDGFILDLDSSIPDYITSLIEVYQRGKERVERLANAIPRGEAAPTSSPTRSNSQESNYDAILTSNILLSLTFASGKLQMYSRASANRGSRLRDALSPLTNPEDDILIEQGAEVFNLPVVSVWGEYRATPASSKLGPQPTEPASLVFNSTVHSSQNTLRPALLPFLTELVDRVESHLRRKPSHQPQSPSTATIQEVLTPSISQDNDAASDPASDPAPGLQISLSLRIDQSKLELTCQPDVNVVAGVHWDSGGFMVNISPGLRQVNFTGSVGGLTVGLKHGFLSEDCARLNARNLVFNVNFSKVDGPSADMTSSVSVVMDTEFSGGVRFSRLQDVLCFKAVWLDRIPLPNSQTVSPDSPYPVSRSSSHKATTSQELVTTILLRFREVKLEVDLGQSISTVELKLQDTVVRSRIDEFVTEVSLSLAQTAIIATGNLSGNASVPDFRFQTIRRSKPNPNDVHGGRMLDLDMTSGPLNIELESEYFQLLHYRAEPIEVAIYDDWSHLSPKTPIENRRVHLVFTVEGSEVVVLMGIGTIPRLMSYANKFASNIENQKDGAARESKAFAAANSPKPDNPLSAVANAMLTSARSRIKEADSTFTYAIGQSMSLRLKFLQLVVFPRSMRDTELAQLVGCDVHAKLDRLVESELQPATRELQLAFTSMAISRISGLNHFQATKARDNGGGNKAWLNTLLEGASEATIFGLPSMRMWMKSTERITAEDRTLKYDFESNFIKGPKEPDDIYITLNMSLYSWLTVLRKGFAREMDQIHSPISLGPSVPGSSPVGSQRRKLKDPKKGSMSAIPDFKPSLPAAGVAPSRASTTPFHSKSRSVTYSHSASMIGEESSIPPSVPSIAPHLSLTIPNEPQDGSSKTSPKATQSKKSRDITYEAGKRNIQRLTMRQLGEATPDVMHPFFMKKAGFSLEDSLPQYVHEYATLPTEEIMKMLLKLYSRQLKVDSSANRDVL